MNLRNSRIFLSSYIEMNMNRSSDNAIEIINWSHSTSKFMINFYFVFISLLIFLYYFFSSIFFFDVENFHFIRASLIFIKKTLHFCILWFNMNVETKRYMLAHNMVHNSQLKIHCKTCLPFDIYNFPFSLKTLKMKAIKR